jgi:hypothetical protein
MAYCNVNRHKEKGSNIMARKERTYFSKYFFVYGTIKLWNRLPPEALVSFPCKSDVFRKRFRTIIVNEKWRDFEGWGRNVQKCRKVKNGECSVVGSEV